jgi:hypothetical protein
MPGVFPDYRATVVRNDDGEREILMMGGMPPPPRTGGPAVILICRRQPADSKFDLAVGKLAPVFDDRHVTVGRTFI